MIYKEQENVFGIINSLKWT